MIVIKCNASIRLIFTQRFVVHVLTFPPFRSLIALSLILSLLQFKPAPMYVLDEVDAALDLSHTQNIGHLLKTRFKGSQFVVVSLKEGMFNNANVLFRARFRDGVSVVERTTHK
jgi:structural maintenance of chromosome 2